jgi:pyridoxal phosphate-dependent aminotransferase EpsN
MGTRELPLVQEVFASNWLSTVGPHLTALENYCQQQWGLHGVALASGTAAIHLGLKALGVGAGDEVLVSTLTFAASANPIVYLGARPIFMDSERTSWNLDPNLLSDFLARRARDNRLPKALELVHIFGQPASLKDILAICRQYELPVLEDAAEALGATFDGCQVGTLGDLGVFSFNGNKIITCTSGGLLVSRNRAWIEQAQHWSTQARDPDPGNNYVHTQIGYNYRLSNLLAGIALGQLGVLETRVAQRRAVFQRYADAFQDLPALTPMPEAPWGHATRWLSCFVLDANSRHTAATLAQALLALNIDSRPVWKPLHTQPVFRQYEAIGGAVAEDLNRRGICLPSSSNLLPEEQEYVIECVKEELIEDGR